MENRYKRHTIIIINNIFTLRCTYVVEGCENHSYLPVHTVPARHQGLHINFAGVASGRNSVALRSSVVAVLSSSSDEYEDEDEQMLLLFMTLIFLQGGWSGWEDDDDRRFTGASSFFAHDSRCRIILWPDVCRRSSVHCSANSSWTCPMHRLYPAAYISGASGGGDGAEAVEFRFRYLTVISRISAFSSLLTRERSWPACNQPITIID